jgi:hypothetical protein
MWEKLVVAARTSADGLEPRNVRDDDDGSAWRSTNA